MLTHRVSVIILFSGLASVFSQYTTGPHGQAPPPPSPYNLYGPINPQATTSVSTIGFPPNPAYQMSIPAMAPYTSASAQGAYPMMPAMYPPPYGPPMVPNIYPPPIPYQSYNSGPPSDPFGNTSGMFNAKALTALLGLGQRR